MYLAAVLEYLAAEILELATKAARHDKKLKIYHKNLQLVIQEDKKLNLFLSGVILIIILGKASKLCFWFQNKSKNKN